MSEVCNKIVSMEPESCDKYYDITFHLFSDGLKVQFTVSGELARKMFDGESGEFAYAIISSFMDEFSVDCNDDCIITMGKTWGQNECIKPTEDVTESQMLNYSGDLEMKKMKA